MSSPSSGYYYNSWYAERTDGPYVGGYYVTLTDSGSSYVDYYTNNPQYVSKSWGYGVNGRLVAMAVCPSGWCASSVLYDWGAYIIGNYSSLATSGYISAYAH